MDLSIKDLITTCDTCDGMGKVENSRSTFGGSSYGVSDFPLGPFENCSKCDGKGVFLTESGNTLIHFMQIARDKRLI
jgi:DnaJ-class molecular chaperone